MPLAPGFAVDITTSPGPTTPRSISLSGRITMHRCPIQTLTCRFWLNPSAALQDFVIGTAPPSTRRAGVHMSREPRAVQFDAEYDLRFLRLPLRAEARLKQPLAEKYPARFRACFVNLAAFARHAMRAPLAGLRAGFLDPEHLAAQHAGAAAPARYDPFARRACHHSLTCWSSRHRRR